MSRLVNADSSQRLPVLYRYISVCVYISVSSSFYFESGASLIAEKINYIIAVDIFKMCANMEYVIGSRMIYNTHTYTHQSI